MKSMSLVFFVLSAFSCYSYGHNYLDMKANVSGGVLKIDGNYLSINQKITYNNHIIGDKYNEISIKKVFNLNKSSAVLIQNNGGGTACPYQYFFVTTNADGKYNVTPEFGTCSDVKSSKENNGTVFINLWNKFSYEKPTCYMYSDGIIAKCIKSVKPYHGKYDHIMVNGFGQVLTDGKTNKKALDCVERRVSKETESQTQQEYKKIIRQCVKWYD